MARHHIEVTDAHLARAYAELHKADWPSLDVLAECARRWAVVRGLALSLANGTPRPPVAPAPPSPPPQAAAPTAPARRWSDHPHPSPDPGLFDPRMAAAGEYAHHGDDDA